MPTANPGPLALDQGDEPTSLDAVSIKSGRLEILAERAFPNGSDSGIGSLITALRYGDRLSLEERVQFLDELSEREPKFFEQEERLANSMAEAKCDLILALKEEPLTASNEALWNKLLDDELTPGPYSNFIFKALSEVDISQSSIKPRLVEIQSEWIAKYGDNACYTQNFEPLAQIIASGRESPLQRIQSGLSALLQPSTNN